MNIPTNRKYFTLLLSDLGLCTHGCVSFIDDFRFQVHISVHQDENEIQLEPSIMAHSLVSSHDLLVVAHAFQVNLVVSEQFCMLVLISNIVVLAGRELMRWLH